MHSHTGVSYAAPESVRDLDSGSNKGSISSVTYSETDVNNNHPIVIGLFGSDSGDGLKNRFFHALCGDSHQLNETSSTLVQRGTLPPETHTCRNIQIWKFPSLHEGTWLQKAEAFLCVAGYLKTCAGRLHGVIYMHGIDDDEGDDAFQLFRALIGGDQLAHSLILSDDPAELGDEWSNLDLPQTILSATSYDTCVEIIEPFLESSRVHAPLLFQLEISDGKSLGHTTAGLLFSDRLKDARRLLECAQGHIYGTPVSPPAPLSPKSPTLRRRPTSVALTSELNEARRQVSDLQHACATLERNSLEQISQLDESNQELQSGKDSLQAELNILKDMLDDIRKKNAQEQVKTQERHTQTEPLPEAKPTREELQNEVLELKRQLDKTKLHEANTAKQVASLSKELATMKSSLADTQKANTELKKKVGTLEKQADTSAKAAETKKEEADKAKAETTKTNLQLKSAKEDLEKAQRQLKEYGSSRTKIEEERTKAISVAEGLLKIKDGIEKQLAEAKSRVDTIKQQASTEVGLLKESLLEKESQLREIARAAETWALASAEAKSLKDELKLLRDCTDAREREAHGEHQRLQVEFRRANEEWKVEQTRLQTTISSLGRGNEEVRDRLEAMTKDKDDEANGYMKRIAELEEWCEHRWDAVGNNCVIA